MIRDIEIELAAQEAEQELNATLGCSHHQAAVTLAMCIIAALLLIARELIKLRYGLRKS